MRLTLMTDYALRLLMHVAQRPERLCVFRGRRRLIAFPRQIDVTHQLALQGWIETVRGKGGGRRP